MVIGSGDDVGGWEELGDIYISDRMAELRLWISYLAFLAWRIFGIFGILGMVNFPIYWRLPTYQ